VKRGAWFAGAIAVLLAVVLLLWRSRQPKLTDDPPPIIEQPAPLRLIYTGEHLGEIEPCGCAKPQLGGIVQRQWLLQQPALSPGNRILIDAGNLVARAGRQQELKYEAFVEAMNRMDYDAAALGPLDLQLGIPFLLRMREKARYGMLAANLRAPDGARPFDGWRLQPLPRKRPGRALLIGLLGEQARPYLAGHRLTDPSEAVAGAIAAVPGGLRQDDILVIFGALREAEARRIATAVRHKSYVIYGRGALLPSDGLTAVGAGFLAGIGGKGRLLGALELSGKRQQRLIVHPLRAAGSSAKMSRILERYQTVLMQEDILGQFPRRAAKGRYVGAKACAGCHEQAHWVWSRSRHARAMQSLRKVKHQFDPECVSCHVTGLAVRGGYTSRSETPALGRVSCEGCHGPGGAHVKTPGRNNIQRGSQHTCRGCHTEEHDPHFDFKTRWKQIKH